MSLVARHLEANGITTVVIGSARDIVEECGVSRFLFTDVPLGNPVGPSGNAQVQRAVLHEALKLAESAPLPRTTVQSSAYWWPDDGWRDRFMAV